MAIFAEYTPPGVYVQTFADTTVTNLITGLRLPVFIGVGAETIPLTNFQVLRGSSGTSDVRVIGENVSSQFDGTNRDFTVNHYPVVSGTGQDVITNDPTTVYVTIDSGDGQGAQPVQAIALDGTLGIVTLGVIPAVGDVVLVSYFFSRTDQLITAEDNSNQADGVNTVFQVDHFPIVTGDNSGSPTTNPLLVTVTVGGSPVTVASVDGVNGLVTLAAAPGVSTIVLFTYHTNTWRNTSDLLPENITITSVDTVGNAPGKANYYQGTDFVVFGNQIYWGAANNIEEGLVAPGTTALDAPQVSDTLVDNKVFLQQATGASDGTNKTFVLGFVPTDGTGSDVVTNDHTLVTAYVGTTVALALAGGAVATETLTGATRKLVLKTAPASGHFVYVTYYYNLLGDDTWTIKNTLANSGMTPGQYTVTSAVNGSVMNGFVSLADCVVAAGAFSTEHVTFPGGREDTQASVGAVAEIVTATFTNSTTYIVTSSLGASGSHGTGHLDQTYIDFTTGLRFTVLSPTTFSYATSDTLEFKVQATFYTGKVSNSIRGTQLQVTTTLGIAVNNTAVVTTFNTSGTEPSVGDEYYISLHYKKTDFQPATYDNIKDVIATFGTLNVDNRLTLAANIAFLNSCPAVALAQVLRGSNGVDATDLAYTTMIDTLETPLPGDIRPNIMVALTTSQPVITYVNRHCVKVSSIRYGMERTGMYGYAIGTSPTAAQTFAKSLVSNRMVGVYPDGAVISITDPYGNTVESAVDGSFLAAGLAGVACNPAYDVATPWTRKAIVGFSRLYRNLDAVSANQSAASGLTIMVESGASIVVRHALTTDMSNVFTKEPTITSIQDYVQKLTRQTCDQFIGTKFLPGRKTDIELALANMFKALVKQSIIVAYQGITVTTDSSDPTQADVVAFYSPVFPLNFCSVTYSIRTSLS